MDQYSVDRTESGEPQGFHALLRFARVVRRHKAILIGFLLAAAFLAVISHKRTPERYEASAKLMVRQLRSQATRYDRHAAQNLLDSYRQLLLSDKVLSATRQRLTSPPPELVGQPESAVPAVLRSSLLSVTFESDGNVVRVSCRSRNPEATVDVIQALTEASTEFMEDYQRNDALEASQNLDRQRLEVERELAQRESQLLNARRACGDISVNENSEHSHPMVQRVQQLNDALTTVRGKRVELESLSASVQSLVATNSDLSLSIQRLASIVGEGVLEQIPGMKQPEPKLLFGLREELATMEAEFTSLRRHYGSQHSEIIRRQNEMRTQQALIAETERDARSKITDGLRDPQVARWLLATLAGELSATKGHERAIETEYASVEHEALELSNNLAAIQLTERQVETLRATHANILDRLTSITIQPEGGVFKVATLTDPRVPSNPVYPILSRTLVLYLILAGGVALGVIYVIDLLDDRLRSPEEVRDELGLSVLGVIRKLPEAETEQARIYVHGFPQTPHAECFRTLKTSIALSPMETKCIAITSSEASEGKTTTTINLAASYAQAGQRTLLIDADMRRPGLSRHLDVKSLGGLSEVLRADGDIAAMCGDRVVQTEVEGLDILPCGPRILNAGMLLSLPTLADTLDWAVSEYDQVIVDCPPTLPVSDAAIVGRFVDGLVFLMNPDKTHRRAVARAVDQLRGLDLKIVGIVANTSLSEEDNSYGYGYGYGYGGSYDYGHDEVLDGSGEDASESTDNGWGKAA